MANPLAKLSFLNPVKYHELDPAELPQYLSKSIERYPYAATIAEWRQGPDYPQIWHNSDRIVQQITSEYGPVSMSIIDHRGRAILTEQFTQVIQNRRNTAEWVWENETVLTNIPKGYYFIRLTLGTSSPTILVSEPQFICEKVEGSVLLEYKHDRYNGGVFFETGISFFQRLLGEVQYSEPGSNDTLFFNAERRARLVKSTPFDTWRFIVGGSYGIPDYLIRRLNRAFTCSYKSIDGVQYEKNSEGEKWEQKTVENYTLRWWTIELTESNDRDGQIYENGALQENRVSIIASVDMDGFIAGGGNLPLLDFE